jgi:LuxR family maltose regulon positive regulatory protein
MARSDWSAAERFAQESEAIVTRAQLAHILPALSTYAVTARIAIHRGDLARAREELVRAQLVRPLATYAAPWVSVGALLELARAYLAIADPAGARNVVAEAEAIARRRPALGILNARLAEMRRRLRDAASTLAGSSALTAAELRLLPILSTPLTFKEIGERVFLSPHTVKTHAISIYGKLQASSRSEAVEHAIELGLLEPFPGLSPAR